MRPLLNACRSLLPLAIALSLLVGCSDAPNPENANAPSAGGSGSIGIAGASPTAASTNRVKVMEEAQLAVITNQFAAAHQAQAELIQKLLNRIDQLEKKDTEQVATVQSAQKAHEDQIKTRDEQAQKLVRQIGELEAKVGSLQAGRVLPEIALTPNDSPTTQELDQKIRIAERNTELAAEAAEARAKEQPKLTIGPSGFALSSADTNFVLKLKGLLQVDSRTFFDDNPRLQGNDGFLLRRARIIMEGTVFRDFDFAFVPDFGGSSVQIFDAWLNYRYKPELQLRAGKFKEPLGFERLQSASALSFNERSMVTDLVPARGLGAQFWGDAANGAVGYAAGVFNAVGDSQNASTSAFADDMEFAGRLSFQPFKNTKLSALQGFGFGAGGSYSEVSSNANALPTRTGGTLPGYTSTALQQFFAYNPQVGTVVADGPHWRISPYATYLNGPFGFLGEYAISHQGVLNNSSLRREQLAHTAWEISGQWVLTGEPASFNGIMPRRPFDLRGGGWGAWQLVARFGQLDIDDDAFPNFANPTLSASKATSWSVGLNWWLNRNIRLMTSYAYTTFDGGGAFDAQNSATFVAPATVTHQPESVFFTRLQLAF